MSDVGGPDGWTVAKFLWGSLMTLLGTLGLLKLRQVEAHEEEITKLKATVMTKDQFVASQTRHKEEFDDLRASVTEAIESAVERIEKSRRESMVRVHETQDMILQELLKRPR